MGGDWMERLNGWIWNGASLNAFCGWKVANLAKFARFSTWVDKKHPGSGMECGLTWDVEWRNHLCCAVLRWVKWTERNVVKGGRVVRHEQRPPKRNEWREWTYRKHMEIKLVLFFDTATANGWWGNLEVFGYIFRCIPVHVFRWCPFTICSKTIRQM